MLSVDRCTGCSACVSICPNGCLSLIENAEGFDYPVLDSSKCTKCNLCEKVCPINHETPSTKNTYTICAQNRNEKIRSKSSAGGIIGAIYQAAFSSCGIAFGVGFNSENNVMFMSAENLDQCFEKKLFASKYVSAEITNTFPKVRDILISDVLFVL